VRGRWGEQTLRNVLEASGMSGRFDFVEQLTTDDGKQRPDVVVKMPGGGMFVIDAKAPLNAYLEAQDAADDDHPGRAPGDARRVRPPPPERAVQARLRRPVRAIPGLRGHVHPGRLLPLRRPGSHARPDDRGAWPSGW
jgi:hypothetical protein